MVICMNELPCLLNVETGQGYPDVPKGAIALLQAGSAGAGNGECICLDVEC